MSDAKIREVVPGVFVVHLPLPMRPTIVNVTLLHSGDEWALIDTGVNSTDSLATLEAALEQVGGTLGTISKIICTHHHPDHFGSSKLYKERSGAALFLNRLEWESSDTFAPRDRSEAATRFFIENGIPIGRFVRVPSPAEFWSGLYVPTAPDHFIDDGDIIHVGDFEIEVITTPGHT